MNFVETLEKEISGYESILNSVPFIDQVPTEKFLKIYRLNYKELYKFTSGNEFPIDSNKLLKLSISLGNLIKSLQQDEDMYQQQQSRGNTNNNTSYDSSNPFESPKHYINSAPATNQPLYQVKFIKNLLLILKSFDIGFTLRENSQSSSTLNQYLNSPIKLNAKQLLIEKLEINIQLDTLFIFSTLLKLLIKISNILKQHLIISNDMGALNSNYNDHSSIFSSNSLSSSDSFITADEYFKTLNQIIARISSGLIEPFLKFILDFVTCNVSGEFKTLITSL